MAENMRKVLNLKLNTHQNVKTLFCKSPSCQAVLGLVLLKFVALSTFTYML